MEFPGHKQNDAVWKIGPKENKRVDNGNLVRIIYNILKMSNMVQVSKRDKTSHSDVTAAMNAAPRKIRYRSVQENGKEDHHKRKLDGRNRDRQKQLKRSIRCKRGNKPQMGLESVVNITKSFQELAEFANQNVPAGALRHVEGLVALFFNLRNCNGYQHLISGVFLYLRDFFDDSMISNVMYYVKDVILEDGFTPQGGSDPAWLTLLRDLQMNWQLVKTNKAFAQFSKLLGILVTVGLCDASDLTFSIHGFKLFDESLLSKHMSAFDLADAIFGTITYFTEGLYLCFKTKSIKPLLLNDFAVMELDDEYITLMSWWDLVKNGNLEKIEGATDAEFTRRLNKLTVSLQNLLASCKGLDKKLMADKITKCKTIQQDLISKKISSGTRKSPFAIELFGASSQGKTIFGDQMLDALLTSAGLSTSKECRAALNPSDKFFSNWTSDKLVAILDDVANEKSKFVDKSPVRTIIDLCNNQMYYAPKAELDAKGKCFVEPEIVLVTTNKKDLDSYTYSNNPYSVQRRMDLIMTVKCKEAFQRIDSKGRPCGVDARKATQFRIDNDYTSPIDDIWVIDVEKAVPGNDQDSLGHYEAVQWRGKEMKGVSATEAICCAIDMFLQHRENQQVLMDNMKNRSKIMERCGVEGCKYIKGCCPIHKNEPHFGLQTLVALDTISKKLFKKAKADEEGFLSKLDQMSTKMLYKHTDTFLERWDWICLIPTSALTDTNMEQVLVWYYGDEIDRIHRNRGYQIFTFCLILFFLLPFWIVTPATILFYVFYYSCTKSYAKKLLLRELQERNDSIPHIIKSTRDKYAKAICYAGGTIAVLYIMAKLYRTWKDSPAPQSALEPQTENDIQARDNAVNVWADVAIRPLNGSPESLSIGGDRLSALIQKNLLYASINISPERVLMANVLFVSSNLLLIPNHYFETDTIQVECYKENAHCVGGSFRTILDKRSSYHIPNTDLRLCYSPNGGSYKDLTKFFPTGELLDHPFTLQWRMKDGNLITAKGFGKVGNTTNSICVFRGMDYKNLNINTFVGMCGAVAVSDTKAGIITGIHLGGVATTPVGCAGTINQKQIEEAKKHIREVEGVMFSGSSGEFHNEVLGKKILTGEKTHPKSPMNFLPKGSQFNYHGTCNGQTTSRSDVRKTPISEHVKVHCGVENKWGAPKMKPEWFGWQKCMANASVPGKPVPHALLETSIQDYKEPLIPLIRQKMYDIRPLTDHENLNGIPGCKFIDAINLNTSIGYPLTGKKRTHIVELEPTVDKPNNRIFTDEIMGEINRVEELYKCGERAYTIAKACKKDEVLPKAKEKCRIFYGNPISLTFLVRKYYLPIVRFLQLNPLASECAVGINCYSPEWNEFYKHATHFGSQTIFGGDYGKYDQKIPSQLILAALRIMIDLAKEKDYSDQDLAVMEAMTGDIVYSMIAFNGDLISLQEGTHISGNSLTVVINGICGSLNLRNFFYTKYSPDIKFRDAAHIMTYGDDNIGSVDPKYPEFNIKGCSEYLENLGQIYTMPDKDSELRPYIDIEQFEFLKRSNVYHEDIKCNVGALSESSIFKSLHCYLRGKGCPLTPKEACAINIDTALREWFYHGKEIYEKRRQEMKRVAWDADIRHMCMLLDHTYEDRVEDWREKYRNGDFSEYEQEFI